MGLFDFLSKIKSAKATKVQSPSPALSKNSPIVQSSKETSSKDLEGSVTVQSPETLLKDSENSDTVQSFIDDSYKEPEDNATTEHSVSKSMEGDKASLKVTNIKEIKKNIKFYLESEGLSQVLDCPVLPARIYCHSILIDKLGDLTKFIISSLYAGYSIKEISELTQMGTTTIKEEMEYLVRGGIINDNQVSLTELGVQYGKLLEMFDLLSDGIGVAFNTFANIFEPIEENGYYPEADTNYILPNNYMPVLARNDNYANSLGIAIKQIEQDTPFSQEIKKSLYTTVKVEKVKPGYKKMTIHDFRLGLDKRNEKESCIKVAIPCDRIQYKARYSWIDPFRDEISTIEGLYKAHDDLLSDKAKEIIAFSQEETTAEMITVEINMITGDLNNIKGNLEELPSDNEEMFILNRYSVMVSLNSESCKGIYLEEVNRENLYMIRYFPYSQMEA